MALDLDNLPPFLSGDEPTEYLDRFKGIKRARSTLAKLRSTGGGPRFRLVGKKPVYEPRHLDEWANDLLGKVVSSTSEYEKKSA